VERNAALDGIRAVAVVAVIAFHFGVPGANGGFLGVDLFFVLSGYLITSILLRQVENGGVRLTSFWTRRIRRLAPAIVLMLGAMIAWGAFGASMTSRDALRADITATLAYIANWHFISTSTYFQATGDESPLLHMWTLAVEEQFYVLWPLTLFLIALLVPRRARLTLIAGLAVSGVLISAWRLQSLWAGSETVDRAYMGTDSRMFGPMVGALVAIVLMRFPRLGSSRWPNTAIMLTGFTILLWGMLVLGSVNGPSETYPRGGALLFALGSGAVIWALSTRASRPSAILALAPIAYVGRISYGIYIWHWPLIVWAERGWIDLSGFPTVPRDIVLTTAIVAVASFSYHAVEKPVRYGTIGRHLAGRRIALLLPAVLGTMIAINTSVVVPHAGAEVTMKTAAGVPRVTKTVILVGDSVPQVLSSEFAHASAKRGWVTLSATSGGCPATAVSKVLSSGEYLADNSCPTVAVKQDRRVEKYRPALVIWWSRYEIAPRPGPGGNVMLPGSGAYWRAQKDSFEKRARELTKLGARLVTVQIEPPGRDLAVRNPTERQFLVGQTLLHRPGIVNTWNAFLASHKGPKVFSISIRHLVCHDDRVPCDDRLANGESARPDGVHYSNTAGRRLAPKILATALRVAGFRPASSFAP
jgi:peptidoglycan/LPS O-acetylase OafA/YrhL